MSAGHLISRVGRRAHLRYKTLLLFHPELLLLPLPGKELVLRAELIGLQAVSVIRDTSIRHNSRK